MTGPFRQLLATRGRGAAIAYGMTPAFTAYVAARLLTEEDGPPSIVAVVPDEARARALTFDLVNFLPAPGADPTHAPPVLHVPSIDASPYAELSVDRGALIQRMAALYRLDRGGAVCSRVIVVSAPALSRLVLPRGELGPMTACIRTGEEFDRDDTAERLIRAGYARASVVEDPGSFAVRGGVLDVFPPLYEYPIRLELFGDEIESIRTFDPQTQRTLRQLDELLLSPVRQTIITGDADPRSRILAVADEVSYPSKQTRLTLERIDGGAEFVGIDTLTPAFHRHMDPLWSYFPPDATWLVVDPDGIARAIDDEAEVTSARYRERVADHQLAFPPDQHYAAPELIAAALSGAPNRIEVRSLELLGEAGDVPEFRFAVDGTRVLRADLERARKRNASELIRPLVDAIATWREQNMRIAITSRDAGRTEKLRGLLREYGVEPRVDAAAPLTFSELEPAAPPTLLRGTLSAGFTVAEQDLVVLAEDEIFGQRRTLSRRQRNAARRAKEALLGGVTDFSQLTVDDLLVHELHGVGQYKGLAKLPLRGTPFDFLHIEYRGGTLYLPVYRMGEVQRYVGAEGHKPRLDKLGGLTFEKARRKVRREVRALAEELLQLYAQRAALPGHPFPPADAMFTEFEATFEFEETPDQQAAIDAVLADMERPAAMDRLVCGDVGYGKTEVGLRAMLKAALGNKQVAMLAPTTVLVEQHFQTMSQRFEGWPVNIARLSRFQSKKQQLATLKGLANGSIDAVVGTHRLLSKDVRFKDLGLLIIDEEQRFGVTHKERLKKLRTQIDVLTLTATPIPRTLHLAMTGLRDLSIIATPPADRRSIRTFVSRADDGVLREAIRRELSRGGQMFFVVPRIGEERPGRDRSLSEWAAHLRDLVPELRVATAHGQMPAEALEKTMVGFVAGEQDVLVSTTIIESGLDIPRANTMFVARADNFGLAQLYQLRGRIGRSSQRAFCYLLVPAPEVLTDDARRRLETLQRFTELGAGFLIASHDLEIRGAGELLGARQSGSIAAVGFDAYTQMLEEAVAELKGEEIHSARDPELNVDVPGFIPDDYVPDTGQRLDLYKRLSSAEAEDDVGAMLDEIRDRYGELPVEVVQLGDLMVLKTHARRLRAQSLDLTQTRLSLALSDDTPLSTETVLQLVNRRKSPYKLTPDMRLQRLFDDDEARDPTGTARAVLLELLALPSAD